MLAEELVRLKVDVLVVPSTPGAIAAKNITRTIPIVFIGSADPVAAGLVDSLARPGGTSPGSPPSGPYWLENDWRCSKKPCPSPPCAVLWNSDDPTSLQQWKESQLPARDLGLQLHSMEVRSTSELENAFKAATNARSAALAVTHSAPFVSARQRIAELAIKNRFPGMYPRGDFVVSGGLISYGVDEVEPYRRAASIVDRILKGTKPADLPVEQSTKFEMVINLKTAKQIGLSIPPNVLAQSGSGDPVRREPVRRERETKTMKMTICFLAVCVLLALCFSADGAAGGENPTDRVSNRRLPFRPRRRSC